jgi:hypothetical protein
MIDTDKYEGHTPGPWQWKKDSILLKGKGHRYIITGRHLDDECSIDKEADAQLIADAPLLLAEVKRLTQLNHEQRVEMQRLRDAFGGVERMVENVRGVFE